MDTFFVYSDCENDSDKPSAHVLLHPHEPKWLVVNQTGFEIVQHLAAGDTPSEVIDWLVGRYDIPTGIAATDVANVLGELSREHFLDGGSRASPTGIPALNTAFVHITARCNLSCPHCYAWTSGRSFDLPTSLITDLIDEIVREGGKSITLSGGEPLLHPDLRGILRYAAQGLKIQILTNGTLLDDDWASFLAGLGVSSIQISVDGSARHIHDSIRGEGSFDKALLGVEHLKAAGLKDRIVLAATIMEGNIRDLPQIISLGERLEIPVVRFIALQKVGRAGIHWDEIGAPLTVKDHEGLWEQVCRLQSAGSTCVQVGCGLSGLMLRAPDECSDGTWCPIGRQLVVGIDGSVFPCPSLMHDAFKVGTVYENGLRKLIHSEGMTEASRIVRERRRKIQKCSQCHWRSLCQAGCMAQALEHSGTIWDTDHFCDYRKKAYRKAFDTIMKDFKANNR